MKLLLSDDVKPVVAQIAECLADWYKRAQTIYLKVAAAFLIQSMDRINLYFNPKLQTQILEKDIITCDLYAIREHIYRVKEDTKNDDGVRVSASAIIIPKRLSY